MPLRLIFCALLLTTFPVRADDVPDLRGKWSGENHSISDKKGLLPPNRLEITEQTGRSFRGVFTQKDAREDFFGVP